MRPLYGTKKYQPGTLPTANTHKQKFKDTVYIYVYVLVVGIQVTIDQDLIHKY